MSAVEPLSQERSRPVNGDQVRPAAEPSAPERLGLRGGRDLRDAVESISRSVEHRISDVRRSEIERVVLDELLRLQDACVKHYIPILVERSVLRRLRVEAAFDGRTVP